MSHQTRPAGRLGTSLAAVGGPLAILLALRFVMGSWTDEAPASMQAPPPAAEFEIASERPQIDAATQRRALEWLATWKPPSTLHIAFDHPPAPALIDPAEPVQEVMVVGNRSEVIPPFTVSTIMGSSHASMATINSKVYQVGDEPLPGWRISMIDHSRKLVEIVGPTGIVIQRSPPGYTADDSSRGTDRK